MSFVRGSNSAFSSSNFFFSSSSILRSCEHTWRICHSSTHSNLLSFVPKNLFHEFCERLKLCFKFFQFLLLIFVINLQPLLCRGF